MQNQSIKALSLLPLFLCPYKRPKKSPVGTQATAEKNSLFLLSMRVVCKIVAKSFGLALIEGGIKIHTQAPKFNLIPNFIFSTLASLFANTMLIGVNYI
jgi:hypothetical protein